MRFLGTDTSAPADDVERLVMVLLHNEIGRLRNKMVEG
jgi:hypothetical protein